MKEQEQLDYSRIATAIEYINSHFKDQPGLEEIAEKVNLSPFHFQRLFTEWAGVSPKKFLQFTSVKYAKQLLKDQQSTLFDVALETGLSGTGRLHDLFVTLEGMTPGEFKNDGENISIQYSFAQSPFGQVIVASTIKGICYIAFIQDEEDAVKNLQQMFPKSKLTHNITPNPIQQNALGLFNQDWTKLKQIKLHLKCTPFQLKVWEALLKIPTGKLTTYGKIAEQIEKPNASRAVGTAIGSNPIAYLIPCHRVIQSSGNVGGYMWGSTRKTAIIGWEAARTHEGEIISK